MLPAGHWAGVHPVADAAAIAEAEHHGSAAARLEGDQVDLAAQVGRHQAVRLTAAAAAEVALHLAHGQQYVRVDAGQFSRVPRDGYQLARGVGQLAAAWGASYDSLAHDDHQN